MPFRFILPIILAAACPALADTVSLTIEGAAECALRQSPALAAARFRIDEARGKLRQAGRLANPTVEFEYLQNLRSAEQSATVALTQRFPITARLRHEKAISQAELAAAEAEFRDEERKLAADARMAAVKVLALDGQRALRERQLTNSRELAEFTRKRYEAGEAASADAAQVDLESHQLRAEILQLEAERAAQVGALRPLLGLRPGEEISIRGDLAATLGLPGLSASTERRPDMAAARAQIAAAQASAALARAGRWEDLSVGIVGSTERTEDAPDGLQRDEFLGVRLSIPLPLWNDNTGNIEQASAAAARREKEADALAISIGAEATAALEEMRVLARLLRTIGDALLPAAAQVEDQLRRTYTAGQSSLSEVIRARDLRLQLERQQIDALRDFQLARIRHAKATGASSVSTQDHSP